MGCGERTILFDEFFHWLAVSYSFVTLSNTRQDDAFRSVWFLGGGFLDGLFFLFGDENVFY